MSTVRHLAGRALYRLYHEPLGRLRDILAAGGPLEQRRTNLGRSAMEAAAFQLPPPVPAPGSSPLPVHLLTGRRFWYQTAFCLHSLATHSARPVAPSIYDDGSLTSTQRAALARLFPLATFTSRDATLARLDRLLPRALFPVLRERWDNYPNLRKLIDPHIGSTGWKLVIDSDLLFFRSPDFLTAWIDAPTAPLHAVDVENSYGYSPALLASIAAAPLADKLNVGLCGLSSDELDWEKLEYLCHTLIERERTSYYLEQALVAVLLAGRPCAIAPVSEYVTLPDDVEAVACRAVMHHYVAGSKRHYFQRNWRHSLPQ